MTENVNETDYVGNIFDEGTKKSQNSEQTQKPVFDARNYLNTRLEKDETTRSFDIRIILTQDIDGKYKVAIPVETHSIKLNQKQQTAGIITKGGFKSFICLNDSHLTNNEDGCPFCKKKAELFAEANKYKEIDKARHKALCKEAYKYDSKTTYITRCIERGKEHEGIKFFRYNKHDDGTGIFDTLKNIARKYQQSGIQVFDYNTGYDLTVTLSKNPNPTPGAIDKTSISIMPAVMPSPLAATEEEIQAIISDPKDWKDMYRTKAYGYLELVAEGETPIWDRQVQKYVPWVDVEELKKRNEQIEMEAAQELQAQPMPQNAGVVNNSDDDELPY